MPDPKALVTGESQPVEHGTGTGDDSDLKAGTHIVRGHGVGSPRAGLRYGAERPASLGHVADGDRGLLIAVHRDLKDQSSFVDLTGLY